MKQVTFSYKAPLNSKDFNRRFGDIFGGSILSGFRLLKGTGLYSVSIDRNGASDSVALKFTGEMLIDDSDAIDAIRVSPNTGGSDRYDVIYLVHQPQSATFTYEIVQGVVGSSVQLLNTPTLRIAIGHVRVRPNQVLLQTDLTSYDLGVKMDILLAGSIFVSGKKVATEEFVSALVADFTNKGTAAPTTGTWARGDKVYNSQPSASGYIGWVCVTAGTPGTWKGFGLIQA